MKTSKILTAAPLVLSKINYLERWWPIPSTTLPKAPDERLLPTKQKSVRYSLVLVAIGMI